MYLSLYIGGWGPQPGNRFVSCVRACARFGCQVRSGPEMWSRALSLFPFCCADLSLFPLPPTSYPAQLALSVCFWGTGRSLEFAPMSACSSGRSLEFAPTSEICFFERGARSSLRPYQHAEQGARSSLRHFRNSSADPLPGRSLEFAPVSACSSGRSLESAPTSE